MCACVSFVFLNKWSQSASHLEHVLLRGSAVLNVKWLFSVTVCMRTGFRISGKLWLVLIACELLLSVK